jgi:endogenous inhibitor of DNA gyrase (YacG/DUF329 family)
MKCSICGREISSKIYPLHIKRCKEVKNLKDYTVKELKEMCKEKGIKGYSKLNEKDLIALIEGDK